MSRTESHSIVVGMPGPHSRLMKVDIESTTFITFMLGMLLDAALPNSPLQIYRPVDMETRPDETHHPGNDIM